MAGEDIFIVPNPADREKLLHALPRIKFPWELLRPGLAAQGKQGFTIEFADLSAFTQSTTHDDHVHVDAPQTYVEPMEGHDEGGHIMFGNRVPGLPEESAAAAWGLFWFDGRIQVERSLMNQQDNIDFVVSAEIAHAVDVFYGQAMGFRPIIQQLLSPLPPPSQPWFGGTYWDQPGESFMAGFGLAYTDFVDEDPRFRYRFAKDDGPAIRTALKAPRTDEAPPPPPPPPVSVPAKIDIVTQPQSIAVGQVATLMFIVRDQQGNAMSGLGAARVTPLGSVTYLGSDVSPAENGLYVLQLKPSKEHPASENFRLSISIANLRIESTSFVVGPVAPPPPPPPPTEKYIVAVKNEFTSSSTGRTIVYFNDNTEKEVTF